MAFQQTVSGNECGEVGSRRLRTAGTIGNGLLLGGDGQAPLRDGEGCRGAAAIVAFEGDGDSGRSGILIIAVGDVIVSTAYQRLGAILHRHCRCVGGSLIWVAVTFIQVYSECRSRIGLATDCKISRYVSDGVVACGFIVACIQDKGIAGSDGIAVGAGVVTGSSVGQHDTGNPMTVNQVSGCNLTCIAADASPVVNCLCLSRHSDITFGNIKVCRKGGVVAELSYDTTGTHFYITLINQCIRATTRDSYLRHNGCSRIFVCATTCKCHRGRGILLQHGQRSYGFLPCVVCADIISAAVIDDCRLHVQVIAACRQGCEGRFLSAAIAQGGTSQHVTGHLADHTDEV